jgi:hypothetical protein
MTRGDHYLRTASDFLRFAQEATDPGRKAPYLWTAELWATLAAEAQDSEVTGSSDLDGRPPSWPESP